MANQAAQRADLILFVTDSDLNETEYSALTALAAVHKPIILVLNKIDLYSREQRERLLQVLRDERVTDLVSPDNIVTAAADPREIEYVIEIVGRRAAARVAQAAAGCGAAERRGSWKCWPPKGRSC